MGGGGGGGGEGGGWRERFTALSRIFHFISSRLFIKGGRKPENLAKTEILFESLTIAVIFDEQCTY